MFSLWEPGKGKKQHNSDDVIFVFCFLGYEKKIGNMKELTRIISSKHISCENSKILLSLHNEGKS